MFHFKQNIQLRQQWRFACNLCSGSEPVTCDLRSPPPPKKKVLFSLFLLFLCFLSFFLCFLVVVKKKSCFRGKLWTLSLPLALSLYIYTSLSLCFSLSLSFSINLSIYLSLSLSLVCAGQSAGLLSRAIKKGHQVWDKGKDNSTLKRVVGDRKSLMFHFTQNFQVRQQCTWWFASNLCSGGEPVNCDSAQLTTWVAKPLSTLTTNNTSTRCPQQITQYLSTGIKRKNLKKNNLVKIFEHIKLMMGGWVGTIRFPHLDYRAWSETTCTLAYIRCYVNSARQPVSYQQMAFHMRDHASSLLFSREEPLCS